MLLSQFYGNILGMVHLTFNSNCFVHALRLAQPWFNAMGVQKLDGPSQCPDLSPLKYFWNELENAGGGFSGKKESGQLRFGCKERPFKKPILPHKSEKEHPYSNSYSGRYHSRNKFSDRHGSHRRSKHYD
ncbi:hypothetical protein TNCV_1129681 [Trichonephila clavipes]|nr:hypothetical protein TNCV_1129681 [Trichonephila clavipes]